MELTERVNTYAGQVERDADGVMVLSGNEREEAVAAMERLGEKWDVLAGYYQSQSRLLFGAFLSVQNLTGIYSPFTVEANYNQDMTPYNIPFTACHELSHLRIYAGGKANFIAWLACKDAPETEQVQWQYAGVDSLYEMCCMKKKPGGMVRNSGNICQRKQT